MTHQTMCPTHRPRIFAKANEPQASAGRSWYRIEAKAGEDGKPSSVEVLIYDEIGLWGISAARFVEDLKAVDDGAVKVTVAINSPGGDVFDGFAIHNALVRLGDRCTVRIDGLAASAASVIACGGSQVVMASNAMMMIHNPWTFAYGTAEELRKTADMMDKARDGILAAYRRKAPSIEDAELLRMLDDETWLTAEEAVALGLADVVGETVEMKACRGATGVLARFKHPPKALLDSEAEPPGGETEMQESETESTETGTEATETGANNPVPDPAQAVAKAAARITQACLKAGIPEIAEVLIMNTPLTDEAAVAAEVERVQAIRDLCLTAKLPELASDYVKSGLSADSVRARLFDKIVQAGGKEIDNKEPAEGGKQPKAKAKAPNPSAIYAARKSKVSGKASQTKPSKGAEQ